MDPHDPLRSRGVSSVVLRACRTSIGAGEQQVIWAALIDRSGVVECPPPLPTDGSMKKMRMYAGAVTALLIFLHFLGNADMTGNISGDVEGKNFNARQRIYRTNTAVLYHV